MPIEVVRSISPGQWDDFLGRASRATIFHTREFLESFRGHGKYSPYPFFLVEGERPRACLTAVQTKVLGNLLPGFASRAVAYGGVLTDDDVSHNYTQRHLGKLLAAYDDVLGQRVVYSEIRNMHDPMGEVLVVAGAGHRLTPHLNFLIDLTRGEEEVWHSVTAKRRRIIKRAREKIDISEAQSEEHVEIFARLVSTTYAKVNTPCFEPDVFLSVWRQLAPLGRIRINLGRYEGRYVGAVAGLVYNHRVFEWFAASDAEGDSLDAGSVLLWEMIEWACRGGHHIFDFGGAGDPNEPYPVREFKGRFRGQLVNFGRFIKIYSPLRYRIGAAGYHTLRRVLFR